METFVDCKVEKTNSGFVDTSAVSLFSEFVVCSEDFVRVIDSCWMELLVSASVDNEPAVHAV